MNLCGAIAQWLEHPAHNRQVPGSSPGCPTSKLLSFPTSSCERALHELDVVCCESTHLPASNQIEDGDQGCKQEWGWNNGGESSLVPMQRLCADGAPLLRWEVNLQD